MSDLYLCGNCHGLVRLSTVKCSDGSIHAAYVCESCGCSWFPWQLQRDLEWQRREDARKAGKAERKERAI